MSLTPTGRHRKKALVIVSDGTDTTSHTDLRDLQRQIRESEVLVYAIGIDAGSATAAQAAPKAAPPTARAWEPDPQLPPALPPRPPGVPGQPRPPLGPRPTPPSPPRAPIPPDGPPPEGGRVDAFALRQLTNDSGGRTEIIRSAGDLSPATAGIADELSRQYFLGYQGSAPADGRWHTIELNVRRPGVKVRARTGYFAPAQK